MRVKPRLARGFLFHAFEKKGREWSRPFLPWAFAAPDYSLLDALSHASEPVSL